MMSTSTNTAIHCRDTSKVRTCSFTQGKLVMIIKFHAKKLVTRTDHGRIKSKGKAKKHLDKACAATFQALRHLLQRPRKNKFNSVASNEGVVRLLATCGNYEP